MMLPAIAEADKLGDVLFDQAAAKRFATQAQRTVLELRVQPKRPEWADPRGTPTVGALAAAVLDGNGRAHLVTSGPLCAEADTVEVRSPSGRWVRTTSRVLGDGAACELTTSDFFLWAELTPAALDVVRPLRQTRPVLTVANTSTTLPALVKGTVMEVMKAPLEGIFIVDIAFPLGTPLLAPDGRLVGLNFRPHPSDRRLAVAVAAKSLDAWLRSKSPADDR